MTCFCYGFVEPRRSPRSRKQGAKEPLMSCDSGMQGQASRSETRSVSEREVRVERGHRAAMRPIVHSIRGSITKEWQIVWPRGVSSLCTLRDPLKATVKTFEDRIAFGAGIYDLTQRQSSLPYRNSLGSQPCCSIEGRVRRVLFRRGRNARWPQASIFGSFQCVSRG